MSAPLFFYAIENTSHYIITVTVCNPDGGCIVHEIEKHTVSLFLEGDVVLMYWSQFKKQQRINAPNLFRMTYTDCDPSVASASDLFDLIYRYVHDPLFPFVPSIVASGLFLLTGGCNACVSYTPDTDSTYRISGFVYLNSILVGTSNVNVAFTDDNSNAIVFDLSPSTAILGYHAFNMATIRAKGGASIDINFDWVGGDGIAGHINRNIGAYIEFMPDMP